jgi:hypothetical protein
MTQSFWESEAVEEQQQEQPAAEPVAELNVLAVSADEFSALEGRILRAVELVKRERLARAAAEERAAQAETQLREQAPLVEELRSELNALRAERDQVRQRVERLAAQFDALEL